MRCAPVLDRETKSVHQETKAREEWNYVGPSVSIKTHTAVKNPWKQALQDEGCSWWLHEYLFPFKLALHLTWLIFLTWQNHRSRQIQLIRWAKVEVWLLLPALATSSGYGSASKKWGRRKTTNLSQLLGTKSSISEKYLTDCHGIYLLFLGLQTKLKIETNICTAHWSCKIYGKAYTK